MSLGVEAQIDPPGLVSFSQCCQMKLNSKMVIFSTDQKIGNRFIQNLTVSFVTIGSADQWAG